MVKSEPYNRLYQEGLIDDQFEAGYTAEQTYGYTLIGGEIGSGATLPAGAGGH